MPISNAAPASPSSRPAADGLYHALRTLTGAAWLDELRRRQPVLGSVAIAFALAMIPTLIAAQIDLRTVNDIGVWVKPTKFLLSLAVYYATLAWYFGYLPERAQHTRGGRFVIYGSVAVGIVEMLWLIAAAVQGVPSHFNATSLAWQAAYSSAGAGATVLLVAMLVQARMIARAVHPEGTTEGRTEGTPDVNPVYRAAVVQGAYIAFVATLVTAFVLAAGTGHWVGGTASDAQGLPLIGWSRDGGDLRVAHFWALHAQQFVPFIAWVVGERLGWLRSATGVRVLGALYVLFIAFTFVQALQGQPFIG